MKKVLSLVLVLTLVLGSFSMVFAADATANAGLSDIAGNANEEAIAVVNGLGIVTGYTDGTFKPVNNVTRAEFAAMMTRALAIPESALAGYATTSFKDVAADNWAVKYLAFCDAKGIMLGDGNGNAMPNRTININEAVTMILRAVGYTNNSSVLVGSWPSNYVTLAQDCGIYKDVAAVATVDRASAAQIIYNALGVNKVQVATDGKTEALATDMYDSLDCYHGGYGVIQNWSDASLINLVPYIGAYGNPIFNADDKIVAIDDVQTTFIDVDSVKLADGYIKGADGVKYQLGAYGNTSGAAVFDNGVFQNNTTIAFAAGQKLAVELKGKTIDYIWSVATWTIHDSFVMDADSLNVGKVNLEGNKFPTVDDDGETIDVTAFEVVGATSYDAIPNDAVVYVYKTANTATGEIVKIVVGTETVTGKITKWDADDEELTINGTAYALGEDTQITDAKALVGETGTAYLDGYGDIYDWDVEDEASGNYAIVVATASNGGVFANENSIKLVDATGAEKAYQLKSTATLTGIAKGDLVEYALNSDGYVKTLNEVTKTAIAGAVKTTIIGTTPIKEGAVLWVADGDSYELTTVADFDTDATAAGSNVLAYVKSGKIVAALVEDAVLGGTTSSFGVVNKVYDSYNEDEEATYWFVEGYVDGTELAAYTDILNTAGAPATSSNTAATALYEITTDADGVVTLSFVDLAASGAALLSNGTSSTVAGIDGNMIKVSKTAGTEFYTLADGFIAYVLDDDEFVCKTRLSKNDVLEHNVYVMQSDSDVNGYDIVVVL